MIFRRRVMLHVEGGGDVVDVDYVDLGLPSGTLWAKGNIAKAVDGSYFIGGEIEYGCYFSWGNVVGYNQGEYSFTDANYAPTTGSSLSDDIPVNATYDAARATLGSNWRMPSKTEAEELIDNTDHEWITDFEGSGVNGIKFMKKVDHGVYIFIPASGQTNDTSNSKLGTQERTWLSTVFKTSSGTANSYILYSASDNLYVTSTNRRFGLAVRPVYDSNV